MLTFSSASARIIDSRRGIIDCVETASNGSPEQADLVFINASLGHDFHALAKVAADIAPDARIVGSSCCGVVGSEGVSESMKDIAVMVVNGPELAVSHINGIFAHNSYEKTLVLARDLFRQLPSTRQIIFTVSGIDINNSECIRAIEEVFGFGVPIIGATSADNMKGIRSFQIFDRQVFEHSAWIIGFADPGLHVASQASHGFVAFGDPLVVTRAERNRILELNHRPAWQEYTRRLGLDPDATCADTIPIGALAERLPDREASLYGNPHLLRVVTRRDSDGSMHYTADIRENTELFLTIRDEERIFSDLDRMMERLAREIGGSSIVAVFHADCLARGRHLFHRILKEELVSHMQSPLSADGVVPPWIGMYGFGEYARLGDRNCYHNYSTSIGAFYRTSALPSLPS